MTARAQEQIGPMRNRWTEEDDRKLVECMQEHGERPRWKDVPSLAGLKRTWKSCKLRWKDFLRPGIKTGPFSEDEENTIWQLYLEHGTKWTEIAKAMPHRTPTQIKNLWNTRLKTKFLNQAYLEFARRELLIDDETSDSSPGDRSRDALDSSNGEFASLINNTPNASSIPAPASTTFETSPEQLMDNEPSDSFWEGLTPLE